MEEIAQYILSTYSFIFKNPLEKILKAGYNIEDGIHIPSFDEKILIDLCEEAQDKFKNEDNMLMLNGDFIIVGDIHGSLHDLLRILKFIQQNKSKVLFLGDYVDRGNFSLECITILFALKVMYPYSVYLIRGNHEFDSLCRQYGFRDEILNYHNHNKIKSKCKQQIAKSNKKESSQYDYGEYFIDKNCYIYTEELYNAFIKAFSYLPLAAIINNTTFCIHGGLSKKLDHIDKINEIKRPIDNFEDNKLLSDVVWSDPSYCQSSPYVSNPRGRGILYNKQAVSSFLKSNYLIRMIRAHECVETGTLKNFDDQCITVFSASNYDNSTDNYSGILQIFENDKVQFTSFSPLPRLKKCEAIYYKVQPLNSKNDINNCFSLLHPNLISSLPTSRMILNKNMKIFSDHIFSFQTPRCKVTNLATPKFTTNRRQSYQCMSAPSLLTPSLIAVHSDNGDNREEYKSNLASNNLPESSLSFSNANVISYNE